MKRKLPHNFQTGQADNKPGSNSSSKIRSNYSSVTYSINPCHNQLKIEKNKNTQSCFNNCNVTNSLNTKNIKKAEHITKKFPSNPYQKIQDENQSKRQIDLKSEKVECEHNSTKANFQRSQDYSNKKVSHSKVYQLDEKKKITNLKKSHPEVIKNTSTVEESISTGIKMQLINSLLGKSEFQSLTQLIFGLLNEKSVEQTNKLDKSKCILFLDYLILRTKKLSYILDSYIQDRAVLIRQLEKDRHEFNILIKNIKHIIYERVVESKNIQSFWHKCEILSEEINLIKNKTDIQNEIKCEYENCSEIKSLTREKRLNFNGRKKLIQNICSILHGLISKC